MNDDQNEARDDGFERALSESLDAQASRLGSGGVGLDAIYARIEQRRNRRRAVAAVGSVAIVGAGVLGVAAVSYDNDPTVPATQDGALGALSAGIDTIPAGSPVWRCETPLLIAADTSGFTYFDTCEQVPAPGDAVIVPPQPDGPSMIECPVPTTLEPTDTHPGTIPCDTAPPEMTLPTTTVSCIAPANSVEVSVPICIADTVPSAPVVDTAVPTTTTSAIVSTVTTEPSPPTTHAGGADVRVATTELEYLVAPGATLTVAPD